jgi:hypothetical protein
MTTPVLKTAQPARYANPTAKAGSPGVTRRWSGKQPKSWDISRSRFQLTLSNGQLGEPSA